MVSAARETRILPPGSVNFIASQSGCRHLLQTYRVGPDDDGVIGQLQLDAEILPARARLRRADRRHHDDANAAVELGAKVWR